MESPVTRHGKGVRMMLQSRSHPHDCPGIATQYQLLKGRSVPHFILIEIVSFVASGVCSIYFTRLYAISALSRSYNVENLHFRPRPPVS